MRTLLLLFAAAWLQAQSGAPYVPDPKGWKLYLLTPMGGWTTAKSLELEVKLVDPKDPKPPKEGGAPVESYDDEEGPAWYEGVRREEGEEWEAFLARVEAERAKNAWRERKLEIHFNGSKRIQEIRVGHKTRIFLDLQDGENRLELRQPDSGQRAVRALFATSSRDRLVIRLTEERQSDDNGWWWGGGLQVVEPDSTESIAGEPTPSGGKNHGTSYTHAAPLPGTFTVRWFDSRAGVDGYGYDSYYEHSNVRPRKIRCEILLDGGTDREKRWTFERLVMPGTKRVTLGSFDVVD